MAHVSCNNCKKVYNQEQFDLCPLCGCKEYKEVTENIDAANIYNALSVYKVIPLGAKKQREVFYQYRCLNKECNWLFWSYKDKKECESCHSPNIEATGEQKVIKL